MLGEEASGEGGSGEEPANRDNRSDSTDSTASTLSLPTPPDGGWGWVVVAASFVAHMIADGCAFTFGVLYTELLKHFKESKGKTAWVGSLFVAVPLLTGPIASALTNKYGCRPVTIAGGLIAAIGFVLASFVNSVEMLCLTFGVIAGFGLSMVYVPAICIVAFYFEKRRAFATGTAVAGSGIGTFLFAPFIEYLIVEYSWRGTLLILGGVMLHIVICGAVFRPLVPNKVPRKRLPDTAESCVVHFHTLPADVHLHSRVHELMQEPISHSLMHFPTYMQQDLNCLLPETLQHPDQRKRTLEEVLKERGLLETFYANQSVKSLKMVSDAEAADGDSAVVLDNIESSSQTLRTKQAEKAKPGAAKKDVWKKRARKSQIMEQLHTLPLYREDIFYRGSLGNLPRVKRAFSCPDIFVHADGGSSESLHRLRLCGLTREIKHFMRKMMDMALLKSPVFLTIVISSSLLYMWYDVPYVYGPDKVLMMGFPEEKASFLISIIGITSTIGQVVIGYIGDLPSVNPVHLYNALTSVAGVATMLVPLLLSYASLCVYAAAYGFFISGNYALTTIIIVNLLGMDKLTNAYGIIMFGEGISNMLGPPLAGWISDYTGSYDPAFYLAGAMILVSGLMLGVVPCLQQCDEASLAAVRHLEVSTHSSGSRSSLKDTVVHVQFPEKEVLMVTDQESVL